LTRGRLDADGIQVRSMDTTLGLPAGNRHCMKNQMEVKRIDFQKDLFQLGDSGSAVFTMRDDGSLECIGMAIGFISNGSAVVTPINAILGKFGPNITLANFP